MQIHRQGEWLSATIGSQSVMMSIETGNYLSLSRIGSRIWELIAQPISLSALCDRLMQDFDVQSDVCRTEVEAFLQDLVKHRAASLSPTAD
ncbi:MAG: PqqD family peptide modification chaperone [Pseudomonadota bacterium]